MNAHVTEVVARPLLTYCIELQAQYERLTPVGDRKKKGQFFTPPEVCKFMASLLSLKESASLRILDPGAGLGSLSAALCDRLLSLRPLRHLELHLFENDPKVVPYLRQAMNRCADALEEHGHRVSYQIHAKDFIIDAAATVFGHPTFFDDPCVWGKFDAVIMNPPYFKVNKASPYARVMQDVVHGQPNMYSFFLAAAAQMLKPNGELVAITPRSFCNGLYFRGFRQWFFERMALDHIHLFESRTETFRDVLQESLITASHRLGETPDSVTVTTSYGHNLFAAKPKKVATRTIIDHTCGHAVIRIPASDEDLAIVNLVESWPTRFSDLGLRVSTGPVVMFRAEEFLLSQATGDESAPLLAVFNVRPFHTEWPVGKKKHPIALRVCPESQRLLLPTQNYVLLRRFSAKEEKRRLTASCLLTSDFPQSFVALENHLNYVYHAQRTLTVNEVYGLAAVFNSSLLDRYFRTISGNTQVNATEIRNMPFPSLALLASIGEQIRGLVSLDNDAMERVVIRELGIGREVASCLLKGTLFGEI